MSRILNRLFVCVVLACFAINLDGFASVWAADQDAESASVQARTVEFAKALEGGDAAKVVAFWTEEGEYVRDTMTLHGQKQLQQAYGKFFEDRPELKVTVESDNVRFLAPNTAIEEGRFLITQGEEEAGTTGFSALYVKNDGKWSIAMLKEHADVPSLKDLAWLIGTWQAEGNGTKVSTTYQWDHSKAFLRMEYTTTSDDGEETGSQMIGLDPALGLPRSWSFAGNGGIGEGLWTRDGKKWVIRVSSQQSDGAEVTATNFLTPVDQDSFTWQSTERKVDGESMPDTEVVKVSRVKTNKE